MMFLRVLFALRVTCVIFSLVMLQPSLTTLFTAGVTFDGNKTDDLALLAFKAKIRHDPQNVLSSWNNSVHFCNWEGVICGRRHKRVTTLDLGSKGLVGSLPPDLGNMSFFREIRLQNNTLQGEIPPELGRLFRLQILHLENNSFEGEIPSNLSHCSNLNSLLLSYNQLVGKVPVELTTLSKLTLLAIADNNLSGRIPPSIGNLTSLETLYARENFLSGNIPDAVGKLKYLSVFAVTTNELSGIIPPSLYNISSIKYLSVAYNRLHGSLPSNIGILLPYLEVLHVDDNYLSGSIPVSLSNASNLERLYLAMNNFTGKVAIHFGGLKNLAYLLLAMNKLGSKGGDDLNFISSLLNCSYLTVLDLSVNRLEGMLPNSIANLSSSLQWLSIGINRIYGVLPSWFFTLASLSTMSIQFNQITGTIPDEIGKLQKLEWLLLDNNRLSGPIPSSLGNLSLLIMLQLDDNKFNTTIPSSLGNCRNLQFLDLSRSNFIGFIPKQLFAIPIMLVSINLSVNNFVGTLPSEIGNLLNLNELYVSQNNLVGELPNSLSQCSSLETLYLDGNSFQGTLPPSFASMRGLRNLDLSQNNLSGNIPHYLEEFALEYLNLSFNNFEGEVPIKGVFANASAIFVQGNNRLCGGIPQLKLPRCITRESKRQKLRVVEIVGISISGVLGLTMLLAFLYCYFRKEKKEQPSKSLPVTKPFQSCSYERILKATAGFSSENLIGVGSFGCVYKGIFDFEQDGEICAVKALNLQRQGGEKSFLTECKVLQNIRHRNLVRIITACSSIDFQGNDFKALVYEYMPNGNLEKWLHPSSSEVHADTTEQRCLSFLQRIDIAIDVGNAMDYLHHHCEKPIIHCDLKPSNILLDSDLVAHIGDFGLAKILPQIMNPVQSSSIGVRGTVGYSAPEYGLGSDPSTSGDVYSYGILLLEMVTGKKPTDHIFVEGLNLHNFARMALADQVLEIVDPILLQEGTLQAKNDSKVECLISLIKLGVACSMESSQDRMDITEVVNKLHSIRNNYVNATRRPSSHK